MKQRPLVMVPREMGDLHLSRAIKYTVRRLNSLIQEEHFRRKKEFRAISAAWFRRN